MHKCPECGRDCSCGGGDDEENCIHILTAECPAGADRRYFAEQDARLLIGRRVQARAALSRYWLRDLGLWVTEAHRGVVAQLATGPEKGEYLVGVRWDDLRPRIPRLEPYPVDWYTEDEYRGLLEAPVEGEYPSASEAGRPQGCAA